MLPTPADGAAPGYFGVYPAIVTDVLDEEPLGRVEVRLPWLGTDGDGDVRAWATLCTPYADDRAGLQIVPEVGSQVVVAFEAGNVRRPYVIGCAWNGTTALPQPVTRDNDIRVLRSRADSRLEFDDSAAPKVTLRTHSGHEVVVDEGSGEIRLRHRSGTQVVLTATTVSVETKAQVTVQSAHVHVRAATATFDGIVSAKSFHADAFVVSPAYTPGVGNIW